jgi:uncharacterized protein with FMN-binding domain
MARKLSPKLVALSSAAIVTVYAIGFARTDASLTESSANLSSLATQSPDAPTSITRDRATAAAPTSTAVRTPGTATGLADGTYIGTGISRHGGFEVAVSIAGGRIATVNITRTTTRYPASRIARLPGQVIERQSASVDMVSGATDSSQAFRAAVAQALAQASAAVAGQQG